MNLVQRLYWFADTKDTAIFWGGCEGHFPIDDMRLAADEIERLRIMLKEAYDQLWHLAKDPKDNALLNEIRTLLNEQTTNSTEKT